MIGLVGSRGLLAIRTLLIVFNPECLLAAGSIMLTRLRKLEFPWHHGV